MERSGPEERHEGLGGSGYFVSNAVLRGGRVEALGIRVDGGIIVGFDDADVARASPHVLHDFADAPLVPAWVNGHVHLAMAPLRGIGDQLARAGNLVEDVFFRLESHLTAADVRAFARIGAIENVLSGVGEVWDHYYFAEEVAEALVEVGLPGTVASTAQDRGGPFGDIVDRALDETRAILGRPRLRSAGIRAALGPHASDTLSERGLDQLAQFARREDLPVHMHLAQSRAEYTRVPRGAHRVLEAFSGSPLLFAHGLFLDCAALERLCAARAVLAYCPLSQVQFGIVGPFGEYLELGGEIVVGTDAVASNDAHGLQRELAFASSYGNLRASFGPARRAFLDRASDEGACVLDAGRAAEATFPGGRVPSVLGLGFGDGLEALDGRPRGMRIGADASFQVLDPEAPELYPDGDLARRLAFGDTKAAIVAMVLRGRLVGADGGLRAALLGRSYREWLEEARARRVELLARASVVA